MPESSKRPKFTFSDMTPDDLSKFNSSTPDVLNEVCWQAISAYNYRAQLDIARILHKQMLEPHEELVIQNIALRIFQLFMELVDQVALVAKMVIDSRTRPPYVTYMESMNQDIMSFYKTALVGLPKGDLKRIMGFSSLDPKKLNVKDRSETDKVIGDTLDGVQKDLQSLAKMVIEEKDGKKSYTAAVRGSTSVKHGFKMITYNELTEKVLLIHPGEVHVIQNLIDVKDKNSGAERTIFRTGYISDGKAAYDYMQNFIDRMDDVTPIVKMVAEVQLGLAKDPGFMAGRLYRERMVKVRKTGECICGSGRPARKCHARLIPPVALP